MNKPPLRYIITVSNIRKVGYKPTMTTGEKISALRKSKHMTQEELAELLDVSRQAVSKWESNSAYPETEKLIQISKYFNVTTDYLLIDGPSSANTDNNESTTPNSNTVFDNLYDNTKRKYYEYKSSKTLLGLPLVHINIGLGRTAIGFFALGFKSRGIISVGIASLGVLSFGLVSLGIISFAVLALGILSVAAVSLGIFSLGAVAIGIISAGAISIGCFSFGALAIGKFFAMGDHAVSDVAAIGQSFMSSKGYGICSEDAFLSYDKALIAKAFSHHVPSILQWASDFVLKFL